MRLALQHMEWHLRSLPPAVYLDSSRQQLLAWQSKELLMR